MSLLSLFFRRFVYLSFVPIPFFLSSFVGIYFCLYSFLRFLPDPCLLLSYLCVSVALFTCLSFFILSSTFLLSEFILFVFHQTFSPCSLFKPLLSPFFSLLCLSALPSSFLPSSFLFSLFISSVFYPTFSAYSLFIPLLSLFFSLLRLSVLRGGMGWGQGGLCGDDNAGGGWGDAFCSKDRKSCNCVHECTRSYQHACVRVASIAADVTKTTSFDFLILLVLLNANSVWTLCWSSILRINDVDITVRISNHAQLSTEIIFFSSSCLWLLCSYAQTLEMHYIDPVRVQSPLPYSAGHPLQILLWRR